MSLLTVENFRSSDDHVPIPEICKFFRWVFANSWGQYLFYPSIGLPISPQEVFGVPATTYVDIDALDSFNPQQYPVYRRTREQAIFWQDPDTQLRIFKEKLNYETFFSCLREQQSGRLCGLAMGSACSLRKAFESEEWGNPHRYSTLKETWHHRSFSAFKAAIRKAGFLITDETNVFCFECWAKSPDVRGAESLLFLMSNFCNSIPSDLSSLTAIAELVVGSNAYSILKACGMRPATGSLDEMTSLEHGNSLVGLMKLERFIECFNLSPKEFRGLCREESRH